MKLYMDLKHGATRRMLLSACVNAIGLESANQIFEKLNNVEGEFEVIEGEKLYVSFKPSGKHIHYHKHEDGSEHCHVHSHDHQHDHSHGHGISIHSVIEKIHHLDIGEDDKKTIVEIYDLLSTGEAYVHNMEKENAHFHEVGRISEIMEIAAIACIMNELKFEHIYASEVAVGYGKVQCSHGELDIPAPCTKLLLKDVKTVKGDIEGELCTPTSASIIKYYVEEYDHEKLSGKEYYGYEEGVEGFTCFIVEK